MTYQDFYRLLLAAGDCNTIDQYIAECGGSVQSDDVETTIKILQFIWDYSRSQSTKTVRSLSRLSQRDFAIKYNIPRRSVEAWESTSASGRTAPEYLVRMLAYAVLTDNLEEIGG